MTDIEKARQLFQEAELVFPTIPEELAARLKKQDEWLFSTREIEMSPYNLQHYIRVRSMKFMWRITSFSPIQDTG